MEVGSSLKDRFEFAPERNHEVFSGRNDAFKEIHFQVQISVVTLYKDTLVDHITELAQVNNVTRFRIGLTGHRHLQCVVVPVPVRVIAFSERLPVPLVRLLRVVKAMCGVKMDGTGYVYGRHAGWHIWLRGPAE